MWKPIADAAACSRCWEAIDEIERGLLAYHASGAPYAGLAGNPLLSSGKLGPALFLAYLDVARQGSAAADHALELLCESIDTLGERRFSPSLYGGFCGVGWATEHLRRGFFEGDEGLAEPIDEALRGVLRNPAAIKPYELLSGLSGFGLYLLERLPHPVAYELLPKVLDHLAAAAERSPAGCTWSTLPEWLPDSERRKRPGGCYTLGVAHGVPGVLGFLAEARRAAIPDSRLAELAQGTVSWLLAQRLEATEESVFPSQIVPGSGATPSRTGWCYGDLGIAAVLLSAARAFARPDWEAEALGIAHLAAARPVEATGTVDATLCHGTAGISHLFLRLHQATDEPAMKAAALAWLARTLDWRRPGEGLAGFRSWVGSEETGGAWQAEPGFLLGAAGIGLALLAAVTDVEPAWDRVMLVDIPPRAAAAGEELAA